MGLRETNKSAVLLGKRPKGIVIALDTKGKRGICYRHLENVIRKDCLLNTVLQGNSWRSKLSSLILHSPAFLLDLLVLPTIAQMLLEARNPGHGTG